MKRLSFFNRWCNLSGFEILWITGCFFLFVLYLVCFLFIFFNQVLWVPERTV